MALVHWKLYVTAQVENFSEFSMILYPIWIKFGAGDLRKMLVYDQPRGRSAPRLALNQPFRSPIVVFHKHPRLPRAFLRRFPSSVSAALNLAVSVLLEDLLVSGHMWLVYYS
jgi:hypothetical protein